MTSLERCRKIAGLAQNEIVLGVSPGERHECLMARYRGEGRSTTVARVMIVTDLRAALRSGDFAAAADLLVVLRQVLSTGLPAMGRSAGVARRVRNTLRLSAVAPVATMGMARTVKERNADILPFAAR